MISRSILLIESLLPAQLDEARVDVGRAERDHRAGKISDEELKATYHRHGYSKAAVSMDVGPHVKRFFRTAQAFHRASVLNIDRLSAGAGSTMNVSRTGRLHQAMHDAYHQMHDTLEQAAKQTGEPAHSLAQPHIPHPSKTTDANHYSRRVHQTLGPRSDSPISTVELRDKHQLKAVQKHLSKVYPHARLETTLHHPLRPRGGRSHFYVRPVLGSEA